jgi:hypothetical protein
MSEYRLAAAFAPATVSLKSQFRRLWNCFSKRRYRHFVVIEG